MDAKTYQNPYTGSNLPTPEVTISAKDDDDNGRLEMVVDLRPVESDPIAGALVLLSIRAAALERVYLMASEAGAAGYDDLRADLLSLIEHEADCPAPEQLESD